LRRGILELGVARKVGREQNDLLLGREVSPGIEHVRSPIAGAVEQDDGWQGLVLFWEGAVRRGEKISLLAPVAMSRPG